jgi:glycosyltransferase involved in cell wall biosynthesis
LSRINVLWVIDHVCYDGSLHGGGRLFRHVVPQFRADRLRVTPCFLRATQTIREVFADSPVPVRVLNKHKFDPTTLGTLLRLIKEEKIDVMHLHCYGASTFGRVAGLMSGIPTIVHDYDTEVYFPYPWYLWFADAALSPHTGGAIAASPMVRDFLIKKRRIETGKIRTMFHAIPLEKYIPVPQDRIMRAKQSLGVHPDTRIVGTVTKLGPQRGNEHLLHAARRVLKAFPDALFLVLYKPTRFHRLPSRKYVEVSTVDGGPAAGLQAMASALGIHGKVRFVEWPENLDELVSAFDFMVAPFLSERFSSVHLLEGMAMGKPAVATDMGELSEVVKDGVNGYLVPHGDAGELAQRILKLLTDPQELDRMSRNARRESQQYSVDAYARSLEGLYEDLAAARRTSMRRFA